MKSKATLPVSFQTANGVTVTLPASKVLDYAGVRGEQLGAVTGLLTNVAVGGTELSQQAIQHFQLLASELVHDVNALINLASSQAQGGE
jgi:hypothetical protein